MSMNGMNKLQYKFRTHTICIKVREECLNRLYLYIFCCRRFHTKTKRNYMLFGSNYYSEHFSFSCQQPAYLRGFFSYFHYTVKNSTLHKWNYKVHISYWPLFVELWIFWGWATATLKIIVLHDAFAIVPGPSSHFINAFSCPACQWITRGRAFFYVLSVTQSRAL